MPRWPPESAGFSTAGTPTVSSAARALSRSRAPAKRGCGTPASASVRRIAILCVIRCAVSVPIPGRPSASATAATTGTARSAETVSTPSTSWRRADLGDGRDVGEVDRLGHVGQRRGRARPGSGRPRRRGARAPSPAGSRGAGGGLRRRRGPSSRARDAIRSSAERETGRRRPARSGPTAERDARARAREDRSGPCVRGSRPRSSATSRLEPGISLQRGGGGTGPSGSSTAVRAAQAASGSGWSPPVGSHWSRQETESPLTPVGQTVTVRSISDSPTCLAASAAAAAYHAHQHESARRAPLQPASRRRARAEPGHEEAERA